MKQPEYKPTATDIAWAVNVVSLLSNEATLAYPATRMVYQLNKRERTLTLTNPEQLREFDSFVIHYQTIDVFREIGYTVLPGKEEL